MSKPGTTWFRSKRKITALVAGAAILAGTIGATAPQPEAELASTWSFSVDTTQETDGTIDAKVKVRDGRGDTQLQFGLRSTWS